MNKALRILSVSAMLLIGGLISAPVYADDDGGDDGPRPTVAVPEPASVALLGAGLAGLAIWRRKFPQA